jgi:hypothetical protein
VSESGGGGFKQESAGELGYCQTNAAYFAACQAFASLPSRPVESRGGQILGRNWEKSLTSFPPCYSQSPLQTDFTPPSPPPLSKSGFKLVCNVNIVNGNFKSENSQDYAQKPEPNYTFMNSASGRFFSDRLRLKKPVLPRFQGSRHYFPNP